MVGSDKITFIVTSFDRDELLREALNSLIAQSDKRFNVIVGIDDPLRDISRLRRDYRNCKNIRFLQWEVNKGYIENINTLIKLVDSKYISFLSDDDLVSRNLVETALNLLRAENMYVLYFKTTSDLASFRIIENTTVSGLQIVDGQSFVRRYLKRKLPIQGCYGVFNYEIFSRRGGINLFGTDCNLAPYNDNDIIWRIRHDDRVGFVDFPAFYLRPGEHTASARSSLDIFLLSQIHVLVSLKDNVDPNVFDKSSLISLVVWFARDLISLHFRQDAVGSKSIGLSEIIAALTVLRLVGRVHFVSFWSRCVPVLGWRFLVYLKKVRYGL